MARIDDLFLNYNETKDIHILDEIAVRLIEGEKPKNIKAENPKLYSRVVKTMQEMRIIGKEKDGAFTRAELERTYISTEKKGLNVTKVKTSGSAEGKILSQDTNSSKSLSYIVKKGAPTEHLVEVIGARFYQRFGGQQGVVTAKTRLVSEPEQEMQTGSRIMENYADYYSYGKNHSIPKLQNNKVVINGARDTSEVKGFIPTLVVARFIQDFDAVGYGANSGLINKAAQKNGRKLYKSAKIDPGNSFGFVPLYFPEENETFSKLSLGVSTNLQNILSNKSTFHTHIPLDYIDPNDITKLRPELGLVKDAIEHIHPNFDTRDLLMGEMTYKEISQHFKPYKQMAKTITSIANTADEELEELVKYNIPNVINGERVEAKKEFILEELKTRRDLLKQIYAKEIEFTKLYYQAKSNGQQIDFEALKEQAELQVQTNPTKALKPIVLSNLQKKELESEADNILCTAITLYSNEQVMDNRSLASKNYVPNLDLAKKMMKAMIKDNVDISSIVGYVPKKLLVGELKETMVELLKEMPANYPVREFIKALPKEIKVEVAVDACKLLEEDLQNQIISSFSNKDQILIKAKLSSTIDEKEIEPKPYSRRRRAIIGAEKYDETLSIITNKMGASLNLSEGPISDIKPTIVVENNELKSNRIIVPSLNISNIKRPSSSQTEKTADVTPDSIDSLILYSGGDRELPPLKSSRVNLSRISPSELSKASPRDILFSEKPALPPLSSRGKTNGNIER